MIAFPPIPGFLGAAAKECRNFRCPFDIPSTSKWAWVCYTPILIPLLLIPFTWMLSFYTAARMSGWLELAGKYATTQTPDGTSFGWQSMGTFKIGGYNNCIRFVVSERGLYIAVQRPFGSFHEPLLIPWSELEVIADKKMWGYPYSEIRMPLTDRRIWKLPGKVIGAAREKGYFPR